MMKMSGCTEHFAMYLSVSRSSKSSTGYLLLLGRLSSRIILLSSNSVHAEKVSEVNFLLILQRLRSKAVLISRERYTFASWNLELRGTSARRIEEIQSFEGAIIVD